MTNRNTNPPILTEQEIQRFWQRVDKTLGQGPQGDCWQWTMCIVNTGYGQYRPGPKGSRPYSTHRLAFFLTRGYWPHHHVCHTCDNRACCNPTHLFEGDDAANMQDAKRKGRTTTGEKNARSKLTNDKIVTIRQLIISGMQQGHIAKRFGVCDATISMIKRGHRWSHV